MLVLQMGTYLMITRHSDVSKKLIRQAYLGKKLSLETKQKLSVNSKKAKPF